MDGDRFSLERAARALVEESEGHVNAYKVWNVSDNCSNSVMLVRRLFDACSMLVRWCNDSSTRHATGTQLGWVHVDVRAGTHGLLSL